MNKEVLVPKSVFLTNGVGVHKDQLASFELALRDAGIEKCNLVYVSSILPPKCKIISRNKGLANLKEGQLTYCVMAKNQTNEPNRLLSAAVGMAMIKGQEQYGYLSEHHAFGQTDKAAGEYAEDLAASMLATTLGIQFDPNLAWDERKQVYKASGHTFVTRPIAQSARGNKDGLWTTVIAAAVFLFD